LSVKLARNKETRVRVLVAASSSSDVTLNILRNDQESIVQDTILAREYDREASEARIYLEKTVRENLLISLQAKETIWSQLRNKSLAKFEEKITSLADEFQLTEYLNDLAKSLSHGQQQWLEIAMAMASEPILLLLDEPTAGMSPKERADTAILIKKASKKCGILIVEHDLDFIKEICDRISVLHQGNIIATGTSAEIENDPKVKEVYLTRV
jgi:ABC-type uncharacterized transport system ATPase subunit